MVGEAQHRKGDDGTRRAKQWLESTTRLRQAWTHDDAVNTAKLEFPWPHGGQSFSFDLGGTLQGEPYDGHFFMAEVKNYANDGDQGALFDKFLAASYVARKAQPLLTDHFMWITWAPFRAGSWSTLSDVNAITKGLLKHSAQVFGTADEDAARAQIDQTLVKEVADRVWLLVLSGKQEKLVISNEHRSWIVAEQIRQGTY